MMRKLPALLEYFYDEARKYLVEFLQLRPPFFILFVSRWFFSVHAYTDVSHQCREMMCW